VDNDPLVLTHARALLASAPEGATSYIDADIRRPDVIIERAAETLDFDRPVALLLLGILGHLTDEEDPEGVLARLVAPLAPGSHVVVNDGTNVLGAPARAAGAARTRPPAPARSPATSRRAASPTTCVPPCGSPGSSPGWSCWSRASCRCRGGGPSRPRSRSRPRWTRSAAWPASPADPVRRRPARRGRRRRRLPPALTARGPGRGDSAPAGARTA